MKSAALAVLLLTMTPVLPAQMGKEAPSASASPISTTVRQMEEHYAKNLTGAADEMPADKYSYRPTPEQMTFAHLMMHIAQSNDSLCSAISGEPSRTTKLSENDSKELLTRALKDSFAYCEQVLAKADDSTLSEPATLWPGHTATRGAAMVHLAADWADHYSAAAMYLRLNNLLPPSAKKPEGK
jgi:uncharacterized damage-inducible protein DinB